MKFVIQSKPLIFYESVLQRILLNDIKMEPSELSTPSGEDCLGHEGTLGLLESWREILSERQVKADDEIRNNTITVSVGPQFEADITRSENEKIYFTKSF